MAYSRDNNPPVTVFSDKSTVDMGLHVNSGRTTAPTLRIDTSSQLPAPSSNPYAGFELALQRYPLQNKTTPDQPAQQNGSQAHQLGQQRGLSHQKSQGAIGKQQQQQQQLQVTEQPKEVFPRKQQRLKPQLPQQIQNSSWQTGRRDDIFPPPVRPASISPHPDHSLYPSYKFIQPELGVTPDHALPLQTPVSDTTLIDSPRAYVAQGQDILTIIAMESGSGVSQQAAQTQAKRDRPLRQDRKAHLHTLPIRQHRTVSKRQKRTGRFPYRQRQLEPQAPTSNPVQSISNFSVQLPPIPVFGNFPKTLAIPMPPPPHPSANFFPFLEPVTASRENGSSRATAILPFNPLVQQQLVRQSLQSPSAGHSNLTHSAGGELQVLDPGQGGGLADPVIRRNRESLATYRNSFRGPHLILPARRPQTSGANSPSMTTPKASDYAVHALGQNTPSLYSAGYPNGSDIRRFEGTSDTSDSPPSTSREKSVQSEIDPLVLPYGHSTPIIRVLNQPPFVDPIRKLLRDVCFQEDIGSRSQSVISPVLEISQHMAGPAALLGSHGARPRPPTPNIQPLLRPPHTEPPSASHLLYCVRKYSAHVQAVYPIMPMQRLDQLVDSFLRHYEAPQQHIDDTAHHDAVQEQVELAIELLIFALGELCSAKWENIKFDFGPVFSNRATTILGELSGRLISGERSANLTNSVDGSSMEPAPSRPPLHSTHTATQDLPVLPFTLDLARAYLLAALSCGQLARIQEAAEHIHHASNIIQFLIQRPGGQGGPDSIHGFYGLSLAEFKDYPHRLVEEERQLVDLYWACVQLEFEINTETGQAPSKLLQYQSKVPTPGFDISSFTNSSVEDTMMAGTNVVLTDDNGSFKIQTSLRGHLNNIYREAFGRPISQVQKSSVTDAVSQLRQQFDAIVLGQPALSHTEHQPRTARLLAAYWEARSYAAFFNLLKSQHAAGMDEMVEVVYSMTEMIRASHHLESDNVIHPNAFGTAMLQCRYVLLLFAISGTPPSATLVNKASLAQLVNRTLMSFQGLALFRGISFGGIVEAAQRVLTSVWQELQPRENQNGPGLCEPTMATTSVPVLHGPTTTAMPELSLYCPPFTGVSGPPTAIPTASTMDSFISFPTPNSPHLSPFSALTSPQHSPSVSTTSASPSPRSSTFVSPRRPFRLKTAAVLDPAPYFMPSSATYPVPEDPCLMPPLDTLPPPLERIPAAFADFPGFAHHLGLSL